MTQIDAKKIFTLKKFIEWMESDNGVADIEEYFEKLKNKDDGHGKNEGAF